MLGARVCNRLAFALLDFVLLILKFCVRRWDVACVVFCMFFFPTQVLLSTSTRREVTSVWGYSEFLPCPKGRRIRIFYRLYLFMFRDRGREGERKGEKHPCVVASHVPVTQACALTGNRTGDPLLRSLGLNPLSHTSQGKYMYFLMKRMSQEGLLFRWHHWLNCALLPEKYV